MIDAGYFAKRVASRPDWLDAPRVREICSASHCISEGPEEWLQSWRHNDFGWFNSVADALAIVPDDERKEYRLFAYRVAPHFHRGGVKLATVIPDDVHPDTILEDFVPRGYDAVSQSRGFGGFECSPLSCNYMAAELDVNEHCLFSSFEEAVVGADSFSVEQP